MDHRHHHSYRPEEYPPPPEVTHVDHTAHNPSPPPQPEVAYFHHSSHNPSPPPPQPEVVHFHHSSHNTTPTPLPHQVDHTSHYISPPSTQDVGSYHDSHYHHQPAPPPPIASVQHVSHTTTSHHETTHQQDPLANKPTVKVYCKAKPNFSLTIRDGKVILAPSNPSDPFQHWVKDEKYSTRVKDEEGFPSFALVNKGSGLAMKHSIGATQPVQLVPYTDDHLDESILWTESKDLGDTYKAIRMVSNIRLNVDAFNGDKDHGGVHDGTYIVLWEWAKGDNQRWKIVPY